MLGPETSKLYVLQEKSTVAWMVEAWRAVGVSLGLMHGAHNQLSLVREIPRVRSRGLREAGTVERESYSRQGPSYCFHRCSPMWALLQFEDEGNTS
jgi:hypothetical protein